MTYGPLAETYYAEVVFYDKDPEKMPHLQPCIIKVSRIIKYQEHFYPLALASVEDVEEWKASKDPLVVIGFGQVTAGFKQWVAMEYMNKMFVPQLNFQECLKLGYPNITADLVNHGVVCVGYAPRPGDPLRRIGYIDTGAPLVREGEMKIYAFSASYFTPAGLDGRNKVQYPTLAVTITETFLGQIEEWRRQ